MAPSRRTVQDDSSSGSKVPISNLPRTNGKRAINSTLKEATSIDPDDSPAQSSSESKGLSWSTEDLDTLQSYRFAHRLSNSSPFTHPQRQALLTNPGIGQRSPTAIAKKRKKTISRQDLATAVRRHFNSRSAEESAVVAAMLYKVRTQDKAFRLRPRPEQNKT